MIFEQTQIMNVWPSRLNHISSKKKIPNVDAAIFTIQAQCLKFGTKSLNSN